MPRKAKSGKLLPALVVYGDDIRTVIKAKRQKHVFFVRPPLPRPEFPTVRMCAISKPGE